MSEHRDTDKLQPVLKNDGLEKTSDPFSDQLMHAVLQKFEKRPVTELYTWPGKLIAAILLVINAAFLLYLIPFSTQPALITSLMAFILGVWFVILLIRKKIKPAIDPDMQST